MTYDYPQVGDTSWGPDATDWAQAVTNGMLQKAGGLFQLLAEVDYGTGFGLKSLYYKSRSSNIADAGQIRFARADVINWRNEANSSNLSLGVSSLNVLQFNGADLQTTALADSRIFVGSSGGVATAVAMSGDATIANTGALIISNNAVTNAKLAQMAATSIKGNVGGSPANASDLTPTQVTGMLNNFVGDAGSGGTKGLVPAPSSGDGASKFLKANGTWSIPAGGGDVAGPASSTDNGFVRFDGTTGKIIKNSAATISNSDVNASAAIAYSKLNLATSIVNADISASAAIAYSKLNLATSILNSDISASAAIAFSKLAALTSGNILVGNGSNVASSVAMSGDVTIANTGATTIANNAITTAKIADGNVTNAKLAALGQQISSSCSNFTTSSTLYVDVTNLTVTITVTGRPVWVGVIPDGGSNTSAFGVQRAANTARADFRIMRGVTQILTGVVYSSAIGATTIETYDNPCWNTIDLPSAGTYTYKVQIVQGGGGATAYASYLKLAAFEL